MRFARKLFRLTAMAVTALALTAASASAQTETPKTVFDEPSGLPCGTVTLVVHDAQGGCHITFRSHESGIPLHAYIPAKTTISNCQVDLEGQIDSNGEGRIDDITLPP